MTRPRFDQDELLALLEALCEERMTPADARRLETIVDGDPDARWLYLTYIDLHGTLFWDTAATAETAALADKPVKRRGKPVPAKGRRRAASPARGSVDHPSRPASRRGWRVVATAACALLLLAGVAGVWQIMAPAPDGADASRITNDSTPAPGNTPPPVPTLARGPVELSPVELSPVPPEASTDASVAAVARVDTPLEPEFAPPMGPAPFDDVVGMVNAEVREAWQDAGVTPSPRATDGEWLRRAYLDITGHIPPLAVTERFLADDNPRKRTELINQLLDDPAYVRHWTTVWTNLLVGRSTSRDVNRAAFEKYFRTAFAENRPWDRIVAEIISAEGDHESNGAANFLLAHLNNEAVPATAITARLFLGMQVGCTQCHNHPFNDWKQEQFWELNSFFQQTELVRHYEPNPETGRRRFVSAELVNKPAGGPIYYETRSGLMQVAFPRYEETAVDPAPTVNRRQELARLMTAGDNPQAAQALVNRIWAHFFGYGFTRPIDDMGPHNPPSHPELLEGLSHEFVRSGYDLKQLIRWIANSEPYQLSSRFHDGNDRDDPAAGETPLFSRVPVKAMSAEQMYDSILVATTARTSGISSWDVTESGRREWVQQFVIELDTDENDEASTFDGTVPQALMMMNGSLVQTALSAEPGTRLASVVASRDGEAQKIRQLCLSALSREPTENELAGIRRLLRQRGAERARTEGGSRRAILEDYQDVFWAFLNSNEFVLVP